MIIIMIIGTIIIFVTIIKSLFAHFGILTTPISFSPIFRFLSILAIFHVNNGQRYADGFSVKGASCVLYRSRELRMQQYFAYSDWPGGLFVSPSMLGTRAGGPIASAWATMRHLGANGYVLACDSNEVKLQSVKLLSRTVFLF